MSRVHCFRSNDSARLPSRVSNYSSTSDTHVGPLWNLSCRSRYWLCGESRWMYVQYCFKFCIALPKIAVSTGAIRGTKVRSQVFLRSPSLSRPLIITLLSTILPIHSTSPSIQTGVRGKENTCIFSLCRMRVSVTHSYVVISILWVCFVSYYFHPSQIVGI
jgi:hypothetical protein